MPKVSNAATEPAAAGKKSLKERAVSELKKYVVITLYLWLFFALFGLYRWQLLNEQGINVWRQTFAIVNALIFGKVLLIGQALDLGKGLERRSLALAVVGKSLIFALLLIAFHLVEELVRAWFEGKSVADAFSDFGGTITGLSIYGAIFFVVLLPFFAFQELGRILGEGSLWRLFLHTDTTRIRLVEE